MQRLRPLRRRGTVVALGLLTAAGLAVGATLVPPRAAAPPADPELAVSVYALAGPGWRLSEQYTAPGILVAYVETGRFEEVEAIARAVIDRVPDPYDEILLYFHRPGAIAPAAARARWTPAGGFEFLHFQDVP